MRTVEDRLLDRLEARQTQSFALRQRCELGWGESDRIDPLAVESVRKLWTVGGRKSFQMFFVEEDEGRPAHTKMEGARTVSRIGELVRRKALFGDGYARFVVAKEIGQATLGHEEIRASLMKKYKERLLEGSGEARRIIVSSLSSMEFQASIFAAALLVGRAASPNSHPEDLSIRYGIDALSARVFFCEISETFL